MLGVALLVMAVEVVLLVRHYDRYYGSDAASGNAASSAPAFERTGDVPSKANGAAFIHRATDGNSRGNYTYLGVTGGASTWTPRPSS